MKKIVLGLAIFMVTAISIWYLFFIEDMVTEGDAYGFTIGMVKEEAANVLKQEYGSYDNVIVLSSSLHGNDVESTVYIRADDINNVDVRHKNVWQLRFDDKETNVLVLTFGDAGLERIFRYRRAFIY